MHSIIYEYPLLPSTNTTAKEMILSGYREGVVLAQKQSAGRGRLGRSFFSENGLFFSVILSPSRCMFEPSFLTSVAAVAVCRTLRARGLDVGIKWVNDLHYENKKVCGILTEAVWGGNEILGYVIGIGLNLEESAFPDELKEIAGALPISTQEKKVLLSEILTELDIALKAPRSALIAYLSEHSVVLGKPIRFFGALDGEGTAVKIEENGGLTVKTAEGERITLTTGEISIRVRQ